MWNLRACFLDVILQGNHWWYCEMSAVLSYYFEGGFVNEKYYYHSLGHCDAFCGPKWRIWLVIMCWKKLMKREDATVIQYEQPIKIEKPLQCLCCSCIASFVKEITLPFSKVKSWLKKQKPICKFSISSVRRRRCTKAREASDVNNWSV